MEKNSTRVDGGKQQQSELLNFYLKLGLPTSQVESILSQQIKDHKELDAAMKFYDTQLHKIRKVSKKFAEKIVQKYNHLDAPELIKKGIKFAAKHQLKEAEIEAFKNIILKGDPTNQYSPIAEINYTEMSKFFGVSNQIGHTISIKPPDYAALNEIARLYDLNKPLHAAVKNNFVTYTGCAPEVIMSSFDRNKHNINLFIHPLLMALFMPKVEALDRRMLLANIGRLVIQRTQLYFQSQPSSAKQLAKFANWNFNSNELLPTEFQADLELLYAISRDPNSLNYFTDESPMSNLLKRFTIQIELWKNVLNLRRGQLYSKSDVFNVDDNITGLQKILSAYDWTYFDSPDLSAIQDEGTMLRKLLAVFSFRPTYTQISSLANRGSLGLPNFGAVTRTQFINTPICNIRLPVTIQGGGPSPSVSLIRSMSQTDWFVENKMVVPKNKTVVHSSNVIFFYVNRRHQSVNFSQVDVGFQYIAIPVQYSNITSINTTDVIFDEQLDVGNVTFNLESVVVLNTLCENQLSTGCSAIICMQGKDQGTYLYYNPILPGTLIEKNGIYITHRPVAPMRTVSDDPNYPSFIDSVTHYGVIFMYVNENNKSRAIC